MAAEPKERGGTEHDRRQLDHCQGVVFSVTIVALQLASSQFTPRVLRSFVADRANQIVLGIFIGTFTYTLLVLRTTRSAVDDGDFSWRRWPFQWLWRSC